ncbi:hypothetical protein V6N13_142187 [Hibiscus sabdariffa]
MMPSTGREYFTGLFRDWSEVHSDLTRVDDFREWDVAVEGHGLDMEDDVWTTTVSRLGLVDDLVGWGFVQTKLVVEDVWADVATRMKLVDDQPVFGYV